MRKQIVALSAGVLLSTLLAGCMENHGELGNKDIRSNSIRYDANGNLLKNKRFADDQMNEQNRINGRRLNSNNIIGSHKNYRLEMNEELSKKIAALEPVKSSYVMLTDHNAYVAVSFAEDEKKLNSKLMSRTNSSYMGKQGIETSRRMSSLSTGQHMLTDTMKEEISNEVRRLRPSTEHIYVSANPDFVGRMNAYMNDVKLGHPIQGFIAEFNAMAERIFPAKSNEDDMVGRSIKDTRMIYD